MPSWVCEPWPQKVLRPPHLRPAVVPEGIDEAAIRRSLLSEYGIEIGGGFGPLAGKIWRVGLMGESSQAKHVLTLLHALEALLSRQGLEFATGSSIAAAHRVLARGVGARPRGFSVKGPGYPSLRSLGPVLDCLRHVRNANVIRAGQVCNGARQLQGAVKSPGR